MVTTVHDKECVLVDSILHEQTFVSDVSATARLPSVSSSHDGARSIGSPVSRRLFGDTTRTSPAVARSPSRYDAAVQQPRLVISQLQAQRDTWDAKLNALSDDNVRNSVSASVSKWTVVER